MRSAWQRRNGFDMTIPGECHASKLELAPDWFAIGLSTDQPERFQGHHAPHMLLVVDEASGVDEDIFEAGEGFLTAEGARILLIGNPTRPYGTFSRAFEDGSRWHQIHISAFHSPNFTGEDVPETLSRALVGPDWVEDFEHTYGKESAQYAVRVLGEFASTVGRPYFPPHLLHGFDVVEPKRVGRLIGSPQRASTVSFQPDPYGPLKIWTVPQAEHRYIVFADVAGSISDDTWEARTPSERDDASAAFVVDASSGEVVAEYHARCDLDVYAGELAKLGLVYHKALLAVEMNGPGQAVLGPLKNLWAYPNLYFRHERDTATGAWLKRLGWRTDQATRPAMLAQLHAILRDKPQLLKSAGLKREMSLFVFNDRGRAEAQLGAHDDRVMAMAGVLEVWREHAQKPPVSSVKKPKVKPVQGLVDRAPLVTR
jgi:hypothetical protein